MSLFSSRAEQLADDLQRRILKNELREPIPNQREWARQMAVGRESLGEALEILQKRGLLLVDKRHIVRLKPRSKKSVTPAGRKMVRILYQGDDHPLNTSFIHWAGPLSAVLHKRGGQLRICRQSEHNWQELCESGPERVEKSGDLLLPIGVAAKYQRMLAVSGLPCIYIGTPIQRGKLPFIMCDLMGAIRHATHTLIRRGFKKLTFLLTKEDCPGVGAMQEAFMATCREWTGHAIEAQTLLVPLNGHAERAALDRFARRLTIPHGILTMPPIAIELVATTLMERHLRLRSHVDMVLLASLPSSIRIHPPVSHYPFPMEIFIKTLTNAIFRFWETGEAPVIQKILPMKLVSPARN